MCRRFPRYYLQMWHRRKFMWSHNTVHSCSPFTDSGASATVPCGKYKVRAVYIYIAFSRLQTSKKKKYKNEKIFCGRKTSRNWNEAAREKMKCHANLIKFCTKCENSFGNVNYPRLLYTTWQRRKNDQKIYTVRWNKDGTEYVQTTNQRARSTFVMYMNIVLDLSTQ